MVTSVEERIAYRPDEAARASGLCRDAIFSAIRSGQLRSSKIGRARVITVTALREFIEHKEQSEQ